LALLPLHIPQITTREEVMQSLPQTSVLLLLRIHRITTREAAMH
jgi:hypothetical protein